MIEVAGFQIGAAAVALTGAAIGWALRPLFLRYRRGFVVVAAAVVAVGAAAYDVLGDASADEPRAVAAAPEARSVTEEDTAGRSEPSQPQRVDWSAYLESAGNAAFDERDYAAALRYWREAAAQLATQSARQRDLAAAIARAQTLADSER